MTPEERDFTGHFHVGYDEEHGTFEAYVYDIDRDRWVLGEVSRSLEQLLEKCRQRGLEHFDGLNRAAVDRIHRWIVIDRPTLEYVEGLWGGPGPSQRGPLGFRPPR